MIYRRGYGDAVFCAWTLKHKSMAWPPAYSQSLIGSGVTSLRWGTDEMLIKTPPNSVTPDSGFFVVENIRAADEIETIYIENGSGPKATRIQLWQGRNVGMTVVDDTKMTPPNPNSFIRLSDPLSTNVLLFRVINNGSNAARKVEAKREITAEYLTLIEGHGSTPPV